MSVLLLVVGDCTDDMACVYSNDFKLERKFTFSVHNSISVAPARVVVLLVLRNDGVAKSRN